jgi:hypothetical protein
MNDERQMLDLLYWFKALGLTPKHPRRSDRFLNPYTNRIVSYNPTRRFQLKHLLWLPTAAGIRKHLPYVRVEELKDLTTAKAGNWVGAGPGESEAILSLFHTLRTELSHQGI